MKYNKHLGMFSDPLVLLGIFVLVVLLLPGEVFAIALWKDLLNLAVSYLKSV